MVFQLRSRADFLSRLLDFQKEKVTNSICKYNSFILMYVERLLGRRLLLTNLKLSFLLGSKYPLSPSVLVQYFYRKLGKTNLLSQLSLAFCDFLASNGTTWIFVFERFGAVVRCRCRRFCQVFFKWFKMTTHCFYVEHKTHLYNWRDIQCRKYSKYIDFCQRFNGFFFIYNFQNFQF